LAADAVSNRRQETLKNDAHNLNLAIRRRAQEEVFAIARKALAELATTELEERVCEVFVRQLRELDGLAKEKLATAIVTATAPALVRSAFDLPEAQRTRVAETLDAIFSTEVRVQFETAPDLISGIELSASGQKVAWSIADFLTTLEKSVAELLDQQIQAKPAVSIENEPKLVARA
jgi:F-type H+-transporting ATPase subunit b